MRIDSYQVFFAVELVEIGTSLDVEWFQSHHSTGSPHPYIMFVKIEVGMADAKLSAWCINFKSTSNSMFPKWTPWVNMNVTYRYTLLYSKTTLAFNSMAGLVIAMIATAGATTGGMFVGRYIRNRPIHSATNGNIKWMNRQVCQGYKRE